MDDMLEIPAHQYVCSCNRSQCDMPGVITIIQCQNAMIEICISQLNGLSTKLKNPGRTVSKFKVNLFDLIRGILNFCVRKLRKVQREVSCFDISKKPV